MAQQTPKYELLSEEKTKEMLKLFNGERTGWVLVGPQKYIFPSRYIEQGLHFYNFKAKPDDTWVVTYPRSGTTLMQELIWLVSNDLNFRTAASQLLSKRFPFLEFSLFNHPDVMEELMEMNKSDEVKQQLCRTIAKPGYEVVAAMPSPRFIKTHFPLSMLPGILDVGCKLIYVARNPKDVAVSWYHLSCTFKTQGFIGDFATFWNYFRNDLTPWSPYWSHLKEAWAQKDHPNLLFIFYEEMISDFPRTIKKVAKFLGKMYTDKEVAEVANYLNIENFRKNAMVNGSEFIACGVCKTANFVRNGGSGGWKNTFTPELDADADKWIEKNLSDIDLRFPFFKDNNNSNNLDKSN